MFAELLSSPEKGLLNFCVKLPATRPKKQNLGFRAFPIPADVNFSYTEGMKHFFSFCIFVTVPAVICTDLINYSYEGDACDRKNTRWHAVSDSEHYFLYCHERHG